MVALLALLLTAGVLLVVTAVTARRPAGSVPGLDGYFSRWCGLHGGYDPRDNAWIRGWLTVTYVVARPLARIGVLPDVLTVWGVWFAMAVFVPAQAGGRWPILAGCLLVLSGLGDSLDGCVAVLTARATRWGYVLDSLVDRVSDGIYLLAVWSLGGPAELAVAAGALGWLQEYVRARAGNAGMGEVGVVTIGERATRVILCACAILLGGVFTAHAALVATTGLAALVVVGVVSLGQLLRYVRRRLGALPDGPTEAGPAQAPTGGDGA